MLANGRAIDHTGQQYGTARVVERLTRTPASWLVERGCCGRLEVMTMGQVKMIAKTFPLRCAACVLRDALAKPSYHTKKAIRDRERRRQYEQSTADRAGASD